MLDDGGAPLHVGAPLGPPVEGARRRRILELVITGGPAAGKSTILADVRAALEEQGWRVFCVPEAATILAGVGAALDPGAHQDRCSYLEVQVEVTRLQLALRASARRLAEAAGEDRIIILEDGGIARNGAYVSPAELDEVLERVGLDRSVVQTMGDAVLYLESAAALPGPWAGTANNPARVERSAPAAASLDAATLRQSLTHPHLEIVTAREDFGAKRQAAIDAALRSCGEPVPIEAERKFLLEEAPAPGVLEALGAQAIHIRQRYLVPEVPGTEERIRRRVAHGATSYQHTVKTDRGDGTRSELEVAIDEATYDRLARRADPERQEVVKTRHVFVADGRRFELHEPISAWLLEVELASLEEEVTPPSVLGPWREVGDEHRNAVIATR